MTSFGLSTKFTPQNQDRIIAKSGTVNISKKNIGQVRKRFVADIFTALVDAPWRYVFCVFIFNYFVSWTFFGSLWYLSASLHGDIEYYERWHAAEDKDLFEREAGHVPCVRHLYSYMSAFLYAIETTNALGYGFRVVTEECIGPYILMLQVLVAMLVQALTIGVIIAKLARPKKRAQNIIFSRNAVICQRDRVSYLMFRVADMQKSYIVNSHVYARLIKKRMTSEGELVEFHQEDLKLSVDKCDNHVLMLWPTLVVHKIDESSPLYDLSAHALSRQFFEIVVLLEGGVESTGLQAQARTSYLPSEILWGHRFRSIVSHEEGFHAKVNYELFDDVYPVEMSLRSAKELSEEDSESHRHPMTADKQIEDVNFKNLCNGDSNFVK